MIIYKRFCCTCVVCDQPKSARTHAHRTHVSEVFSHAHAHVRARTHLRNPWLANQPMCYNKSHLSVFKAAHGMYPSPIHLLTHIPET